MDRRGKQATGMRDGYLRGALPRPMTPRQMDVLAAFVAAGGSVSGASELARCAIRAVQHFLDGARLSTIDSRVVDASLARRGWIDIRGCGREDPVSEVSQDVPRRATNEGEETSR